MERLTFRELKDLLIIPNIPDHLESTVDVIPWLGLAWLLLRGSLMFSYKVIHEVSSIIYSTETFSLLS